MDCVAIIPARYQSVRFPGKPLASLDGRPLIEHVVRRVASVPEVSRVLVATDDERIAAAAVTAGAEARMTPADLPSGTDRVAFVARDEDYELILNVQGDEPLIEPDALSAAIRGFAGSSAPYGTLRAPVREARDLFDPNVVKVVVDDEGKALYFSRAPIPFPRAAWLAADNRPGEPAIGFAGVPELPGPWWIHVGVYLYRRRSLERWARMPPSTLERVEGLEQLRVLQAGETIITFPMTHSVPGVDTPADLQRVERLLAAGAASENVGTGGANG